MKTTAILCAAFAAFVSTLAAGEYTPSSDQSELEELRALSEPTDAQIDRMEYLESQVKIIEVLERLAATDCPHVFEMLREIDKIPNTMLWLQLYGRDMRFADAFDAEAKIRDFYPFWVRMFK